MSRQLNRFEIDMYDEQVISIGELLDMIDDNNPMITQLILSACNHSTGESNSAELLGLARDHPSLLEIEMKCYRFTVDNVFALIGRLKGLKMFRFMMTQSEYARFIAKINNNEWQTEQNTIHRSAESISYIDVTIKRKEPKKSAKKK